MSEALVPTRSLRAARDVRFAAASLIALTAALGAGAAVAQTADAATDTGAVEEIVVTGSRIARTGFTTPTPVTVVGQEQIARQGVTNVAEALNQIPAFRPQSTPATVGVFVNNLGASTADLRGLGANRTLVLVDGRRFVPSTVAGSALTPGGTVDLNMIPTSLIERSEVVTGGASAQYGSDAVAGVVNLILNKTLKGVRAQVQYGISEEGDNEEFQASLAAGTDFLGGRGHVVIAGEYINNHGVGDCYTRDWCRSVNNVSNGTPGVNGLPAQLLLPNTNNATATPGGLINAGPLRGTQFDANGQPVPFNYGTFFNAGLWNSLPTFQKNNFYINTPIIAPVERYNLFTHAEYNFTPTLKGFVDASFGKVQGRSLAAQVRDFAVTIQRDNPYLPAATAAAMDAARVTSLTVGRIANDLGPVEATVKRDTTRIATGFDGELGWGLKFNTYYQFGQTNYDQVGKNTKINANWTRAIDAVINPANGQITCRSLLSTDPAVRAAAAGCAPINLIGENRFSPESKAYTYGTATQNTRFIQHVAAANVTGDLFSLPAGPVSFAVGGEFRSDSANGGADPISRANGFYTNNGAAIKGSVDVYEGYVETVVPLLRDVSFAKSLEFNGAVRGTHYSSTGGVMSYKVGGVYEPTDFLRFRLTQSRDIRAPSLFELYSPLQSSFTAVRDPSNNQQTLTQTFVGGNENLKPETANTFTVGAVFSPKWSALEGLRLSVDYYDIDLKDAISSLGAQVILTRCAAGVTEICQLVVRGSNGIVQQIFNRNLNLNQVTTRGVDFEASYVLPLSRINSGWDGRLTFTGLATYVKDLITKDSAGVSVDRAGQDGGPTSQPSGVPSWTASLQATYTQGPFSFTTQARYIAAGAYDTTLQGPDAPNYNIFATNSINDNTIPAFVYWNLNAQYNIVDRAERQIQVYGAVSNVFDKSPPASPSSYGQVNAVLYDTVGRTFRMGVRLRQ